MEQLINQLKRHEGFSAKLYRCPAGKLTIGYGINLEEGISQEVAEMLLHHKVMESRNELVGRFPGFTKLDPVRQDVITNMHFNMGINRLLGFRKMIAALSAQDYDTAAHEMMDSRWALQVGRRAAELSTQMRTGRYA